MIGHRTERPRVSRTVRRGIHCAAMRRGRTILTALAVVLTTAIASACTAASGGVEPLATDTPATAAAPGAKLDHLIFIVQENRSFDHYFGTYPGADGIPTKPDGSFSVCAPDPYQGGKCVPPYRTKSFDFDGGPHTHAAAVRDVNTGQMNGFIES